jgi:hypothetical protein
VEQLAVTALPDELVPASQLPRRPLDSVLDSPLTQTGVLIGTPAYMAPEQFAGRAPDARSDQFAYCITAWEALAGKRPFRGSTLLELEAAAGGGVRSADADLPAPVRAVLARGLDPSPDARWPDLRALLGALAQAMAPAAPAGRSRRRKWVLGTLISLASIAFSVGLSVALDRAFDGEHSAADVMACGPADAAFGDAWSPARRAAVQKVHSGGILIGGVAALEGFRGAWIEAYNQACAMPAGAERESKLMCLGDARDELASATARLTERGSRFDLGTIAASFSIKFALCGIDVEKEVRRRVMPPVPPVPPVPPPGPGPDELPEPQ